MAQTHSNEPEKIGGVSTEDQAVSNAADESLSNDSGLEHPTGHFGPIVAT